MRRFLMIVMLAGLSATGLVVPTPASAQVTPTVGLTSATLVANGAAVRLTYTMTCEPGTTAYVNTQISQRFGVRVGQGSGGSGPLACTGSPETVTFLVRPYIGSAPFHVGTALLITSATFCDPFGCVSLPDVNQVVSLRRS